MRGNIALAAFVVSSIFMVSAAAAQSGADPTVLFSSNDVSFFNGDQASIDATVKNNDLETRTFTVSVFPNSLDKVSAFPSKSHVTLAPQESATFQISFSSMFEAEFIPRKFSVTIADTEDASISTTGEVFVKILRRSPVFVLSLNTNKFSYLPGETLNVSYVVANNGGDSFDAYTVQTAISTGREFLKRFESSITFLPERSQNTFSNLYTFDQFSKPGTYSVQLTLLDATGQTINTRSVNLKVGEVSRTTQEESVSYGVFDTTTTIKSRNEGNAPSDMAISATIPTFARDLFASDTEPDAFEEVGASTKVTWLFEGVEPDAEAAVSYNIVIWKIWATALGIAAAVWLAFRFVFTVRIMKRSQFAGAVKRDAEIPVSIEVVNRSLNEVKDVVVRDLIPGIATVVPKFQTVKPGVSKTAKGTEVVWKFDSLRAGEERIVTYRIKPKMDVIGSLRLNPATVSYATKDRKKKSAASGIVVVKKSE